MTLQLKPILPFLLQVIDEDVPFYRSNCYCLPISTERYCSQRNPSFNFFDFLKLNDIVEDDFAIQGGGAKQEVIQRREGDIGAALLVIREGVGNDPSLISKQIICYICYVSTIATCPLARATARMWALVHENLTLHIYALEVNEFRLLLRFRN